MKRTWLIGGALLVIVAGVVAWRMLQPAAEVDVAAPQRGLIRAYVEEQAVTRLPVDYPISMPISGWLEPIALREGDPVREGEVLARLDTGDLRDRVSQAEQRIAVLETNLRDAQDDRLESNALTQSEAAVKALDETVAAAEKRAEASEAIMEFAQTELTRVESLRETETATDREVREAQMNFRRAQADYQGDLLIASALRTIAAVSYLGPKSIRDYIDRKSFDVESLENQLKEARAALDIERRNLDRAEVRSPINGVVLERFQTRRQFLPAGAMLLRIGRLEDLEVIVEVLTERATRIAPGDPVDIYGEALSGSAPTLPEGALAGRVLRIYPSGFRKISSLGVEQQRVIVAVQIDQRPPQLGAEYRVQVRIYHDEARDALIVPRTALFRGPAGQWQVMVVQSGRLALRDVKVGLMNDDQAQVVSGLDAQSQVVLRPARDLTAGMRVAARVSGPAD